jgi:hypothetical protein
MNQVAGAIYILASIICLLGADQRQMAHSYMSVTPWVIAAITFGLTGIVKSIMKEKGQQQEGEQ